MKSHICGIPNRKVPLDRNWFKTRTCFSVKTPVEWNINQPSRRNLRWDATWRSYMPKNSDVKLAKRKKSRKYRIYIMLAKWWKWKMLHWLTKWHYVWTQPGTMWRCGGVPCTKNYSLPSGNEEYHTTAPQCETLHSRTLCWFAYFTASRLPNKTNNASTVAVSVFILHTSVTEASKWNLLLGWLYTFCILHFAGISRMFSQNTPRNAKHSPYTFVFHANFVFY